MLSRSVQFLFIYSNSLCVLGNLIYKIIYTYCHKSNSFYYYYYDYFTARISGSGRFVSYPLPLLNWFGAQTFCRTFHTDLASATNSIDNNALKNQVIIFTSFWFGLYRGTWTWIDGTTASNIPWSLFQPDNLLGTQNCGVFALGLISDETCTSQYAFYCHSSEYFVIATVPS